MNRGFAYTRTISDNNRQVKFEGLVTACLESDGFNRDRGVVKVDGAVQ